MAMIHSRWFRFGRELPRADDACKIINNKLCLGWLLIEMIQKRVAALFGRQIWRMWRIVHWSSAAQGSIYRKVFKLQGCFRRFSQSGLCRDVSCLGSAVEIIFGWLPVCEEFSEAFPNNSLLRISALLCEELLKPKQVLSNVKRKSRKFRWEALTCSLNMDCLSFFSKVCGVHK